MNDEENKLKEAFELSDLLYSKRKDEIMSGLKEKLSEITEEFIGAGGFFDSRHVEFLLKERIKRAKELVPYRLNFDLQNVEKVLSPIRENIYKKIYKRVSRSIEQEMKNVRVQMINFFGNDPFFLSFCLKPMNKTVDEEKCRLLENVKKDIEIHRKMYELRSDGIKLSREQERDYEKYGYNCKDRIYIPGTPSVNRNFIILLNGKETKIKDANFLLLLRFVVELKKGKGGRVHLNDLEKDKTIPNRLYYQYINRLNNDLKINIMFCKYDKKQLIEGVGAGYYRISTHPDFVTFNLDNLLNYPDDSQIIDLAKRLEEIEKNL